MPQTKFTLKQRVSFEYDSDIIIYSYLASELESTKFEINHIGVCLWNITHCEDSYKAWIAYVMLDKQTIFLDCSGLKTIYLKIADVNCGITLREALQKSWQEFKG